MRVLIALWLGFVEDVLSVLLEIFRVLFFSIPLYYYCFFLENYFVNLCERAKQPVAGFFYSDENFASCSFQRGPGVLPDFASQLSLLFP